MRVPSLAGRLAGGVWGHLVGDAIGLPYEFSRPEDIGSVEWGHVGSHGQPPGTWSDDGGLTLALLSSLLRKGFDLDDQAAQALRWLNRGEYAPDGRFDIGRTTAKALHRLAAGIPPAEAGGSGGDSLSNGGLMRVLPVALVGHLEHDEVLVAQAVAASGMTHRHPRSLVTCAVYVLAARNLLHGPADRQDSLETAIRSVSSLIPASWREDFALFVGFRKRTGRGYVLDTFWSAWDAFRGASSYEEVIHAAVRYGRDTDTTASVAGGLAGIFWGLEGIPADWLRDLRGREIVDPLVAELVSRLPGGGADTEA